MKGNAALETATSAVSWGEIKRGVRWHSGSEKNDHRSHTFKHQVFVLLLFSLWDWQRTGTRELKRTCGRFKIVEPVGDQNPLVTLSWQDKIHFCKDCTASSAFLLSVRLQNATKNWLSTKGYWKKLPCYNTKQSHLTFFTFSRFFGSTILSCDNWKHNIITKL